MATYKCSKCGATGDSKCIASRNFFPDDQNESVLSWVLKYEVKTEPCKMLDDSEEVKHTVHLYHYWINKDVDKQEALLNLFRTIRAMPEDTMMRYICDHDYRLTAPRCELGCCSKD